MITILSDDTYFAIGAEAILSTAGHKVVTKMVSSVFDTEFPPSITENETVLIAIENKEIARLSFEKLKAFRVEVMSFIDVPKKDQHLLSLMKGVAMKSISCRLLPTVLAEMKEKEGYKPNSLTRRETEVMNFLISGKSIDDISFRLSITPKTVSAHKCSALKKIGMSKTNSHAILTYETYITLLNQSLMLN